MTDVEGRRYLDCLAGYSALNFGHCHPQLLRRAHEQLDRLTLTSRAFYNDQLGPFARDLAALTGKEMSLPMNSGAEAVETAIKVARKWGYLVKGVHENRANIVAMEGNFHGRTTTIVSFSTDSVATQHYAPYTPGFRLVPFGDIEALRAAVDEDTVAVLLEPIQGESGVIIPPDGFLHDVRTLCNSENVLMLADEIQSGLARTGRTFACDHEDVVPDMYILGKALGGGLYPVSAVAANGDVLEVITPGSHGSTFGGNPLGRRDRSRGRVDAADRRVPGACREARRAPGRWAGAAGRQRARRGPGSRPVGRNRLDPGLATGRDVTESLLEEGILAKEAHGQTVRLAPPLVATEEDLDLLIAAFAKLTPLRPAFEALISRLNGEAVGPRITLLTPRCAEVVARDVPLELVADQGGDPRQHRGRAAGDVRGDEHVGRGPERMAVGERLRVGDVEREPQPAGLRDHRVLVDHSAPGTLTTTAPSGKPAEQVGVDEAAGGVVQGKQHHDDVLVGQQVRQVVDPWTRPTRSSSRRQSSRPR